MNLDEIKALIKTEPYNFLRENPRFRDRMLYLALGGSHAYGTSVPTSDLDLRGFSIEYPNEIIGLQKYDMDSNSELDVIVYGFTKMIELLSKCNPNIIEFFTTKDEHILFMRKEGALIRDNLGDFYSRAAINSFMGYAMEQLYRLKMAYCSEDETEKIKRLVEVLTRKIEHFNDTYKLSEYGTMKIYLDDASTLRCDLNVVNYPFLDFKSVVSESMDVVKNYRELNHRNKKKDDSRKMKHFMHLFRLFCMGAELLSTGKTSAFREKEHKFLMDIRNEVYTPDELFAMLPEYENNFKYAADNTVLPEEPNLSNIEDMVMEIRRSVIYDKYSPTDSIIIGNAAIF